VFHLGRPCDSRLSTSSHAKQTTWALSHLYPPAPAAPCSQHSHSHEFWLPGRRSRAATPSMSHTLSSSTDSHLALTDTRDMRHKYGTGTPLRARSTVSTPQKERKEHPAHTWAKRVAAQLVIAAQREPLACSLGATAGLQLSSYRSCCRACSPAPQALSGCRLQHVRLHGSCLVLLHSVAPASSTNRGATCMPQLRFKRRCQAARIQAMLESCRLNLSCTARQLVQKPPCCWAAEIAAVAVPACVPLAGAAQCRPPINSHPCGH